jgi:integrase
MGQISQLVFSEGERYPLLVDGEGMPDYWVTLYVTENLRPNLKQTAIENAIRHIIHLKLWEEINDRDLIAEFSVGKFLSDIDIISIRDHCLLNTYNLREWHESSRKKNVSRISLSHPATTRSLPVVSKAHTANRLAQIAAFLHFSARTMLRERPNFTALTDEIAEMKKRIIAQKPIGQGKNAMANDPSKKAPAPEVFEKLMQTIREDSPDNPYKAPDIRKRNAVMFELMEATGMRSGEILALYIGDVDCQLGIVSVVRRHDNPLDERKRQPVAKTLERDIPIKRSVAQRVRNYVMDVRAEIAGANKSPFLFVTHKRGKFQGKALSDSSFRNRVLGPATAANPELFDEVSRHGFRHNFNYHLSKKIDAHNLRAKIDPSIKPISEKEEIQIRMQLNGWSSEASAQIYNLRHIQELANKFQREDMDELSEHLKNGKNKCR